VALRRYSEGMRWIVSGLLAAVLLNAADPLQVLQPVISQSDGGTPVPPGFAHAPGEVLFFTFQVGGYAKNSEEKVKLSYTVKATDPAGVLILEPVQNQIVAELTPHDKEWKPKVRMEIPIPPLAGSGTYQLSIDVRDENAQASAAKSISFAVAGHEVEPSPTLVIRNFRFYRAEDDLQALPKPVYRPGDPVWARFDIIGYKFGTGNAVDVSYGIAVLAGEKVLWSQNDAAVERSQSFYPKRYVPGAMSINLQPNISPGEYTIAVRAKDGVGSQECESKYTFTVEQ
jgi:hypothetical protein